MNDICEQNQPETTDEVQPLPCDYTKAGERFCCGLYEAEDLFSPEDSKQYECRKVAGLAVYDAQDMTVAFLCDAHGGNEVEEIRWRQINPYALSICELQQLTESITLSIQHFFSHHMGALLAHQFNYGRVMEILRQRNKQEQKDNGTHTTTNTDDQATN